MKIALKTFGFLPYQAYIKGLVMGFLLILFTSIYSSVYPLLFFFFFFFLKIHLFDVHFFTKIFLCLITSSKEQILSLNFTVNIKVSMTSNYETVKSLLKYKQKPWS